MERIAFILGERFVYWSPLILALAAAAGSCAFLALYLAKGGRAAAGTLAVPLAIAASLVLGRLLHWYCRTDSYPGFYQAMTDYSSGGFALLGAFAGCFLAAAVLRLLRISPSLPGMLDAMSVAGSLAIALGRLGSFFNASDRGQILEGLTELPWVYPVANAVTGAAEYRLATFLLQALAAGTIFLVLLVFYLTGNRRKGDTALLFLLFYGVSQVVLDSTRYDSLFFRRNGFVSMVQVFAALGMALVIVVFSVRMVKMRGFHVWYLLPWLLTAGCIGGAGYMEYYVQRHGDQAAFAYSVMSACLLGVVLLTLILRLLGNRRRVVYGTNDSE